ncbi:MAG: class I SAM-dependent methyltransferase [Thermosphaera sp.]
MIYQNPRPTKGSLPLIYPKGYDQYISYKNNGISYFFHQYGLRKRYKIILRYKNHGNLLDIGCATGDFIEYLSKVPGWSCTGIEPSEHAIKKSHVKHLIYQGDLEYFCQLFPQQQFDVVTLWNVIEHVHSPTRELSLIFNLLKDDGILVITTPNVNSTIARIFGKYWIGYELPRHLFVFSEQTIKNLLEKTGYKITKCSSIYGEHAAFMSSLRFFIRYITNKRPNLNVLYSLPIRIALAPIFYILTIRNKGSGLTIVAQKQSWQQTSLGG